MQTKNIPSLLADAFPHIGKERSEYQNLLMHDESRMSDVLNALPDALQIGKYDTLPINLIAPFWKKLNQYATKGNGKARSWSLRIQHNRKLRDHKQHLAKDLIYHLEALHGRLRNKVMQSNCSVILLLVLCLAETAWQEGRKSNRTQGRFFTRSTGGEFLNHIDHFMKSIYQDRRFQPWVKTIQQRFTALRKTFDRQLRAGTVR